MHYLIFCKHLLKEVCLYSKQIYLLQGGRWIQAQDPKSQENNQNTFEFI